MTENAMTREFHEQVLNYYREYLKRPDAMPELPAMLYMLTPEGEIMQQSIQTMMGSVEHKNLMVSAMRELVSQNSPLATLLVLDTWVSVDIAPEDLHQVSPREDPERLSVLVLVLEDAQTHQVTHYQLDSETRELSPFDFGFDPEKVQVQSRFVWYPHNIEVQEQLSKELPQAKPAVALTGSGTLSA